MRAELREIRNKLANFSVNEDENANIVETKNDINANTIIAKKDVKISVPAEKIIDNASKQCSDSNEKKKEPEYRVTDETEQLRIKTADERASRRARRQDRMAKLAKEQTDDCNKTENSTEINGRDRKGDKKDDENSVRSMSSLNGPVSEVSSRRRETKDETAKDNVESRSKGYLSDRKAEIAKVAEDANKNTRPLSQKLNINIGKKEDSNNNNVGKSTLNSYGNTARIFTQKKEEERKQEDEEDKNAIKNSCSSSSSSFGGVNKHSSWKRSEDESNIVPKPEVKYMKSKENASTAFVNAPASLTTRTERKEERTVAVGVGGKMEGVKHQVETKSFMQNSQQFSNTKTTTSRVSSVLDRFNGGGNDKSKALSTIGKALGPGSARNRFLNAEKVSIFFRCVLICFLLLCSDPLTPIPLYSRLSTLLFSIQFCRLLISSSLLSNDLPCPLLLSSFPPSFALLCFSLLFSILLSSTLAFSAPFVLLCPYLFSSFLLCSPLSFSVLLCSPLPSSVLLCSSPLSFSVILCSPLSFSVILCSPLFSSVHICSPLSISVLLCPSLFSSVLLCSPLSFSVLLCPSLSFSVLLCPSLSFSVLLYPTSALIFPHLLSSILSSPLFHLTCIRLILATPTWFDLIPMDPIHCQIY